MGYTVIRSGEKAILALPSKEHLGSIQKFINDQEVNRFLRFPSGLYFPEDENEWYDHLRSTKSTDRVLMIVEKESGEPAGVIGMHHFDPVGRHAELGYLLGKEFWNRGIGTEAVRLMLEYGKDAWNLRKSYASVKEGNEASKRLLEKNGFKYCGRFSKHDYVPGTGFVDLLYFEYFY